MVVLSGACLLFAVPAAARTATYHGFRVSVPAGWPVYRLAGDPRTCVRFDRHAVYLGQPGASERCPVTAPGRTEAILVSPHAVRVGGGALMRFRAARVVVTATWNRRPAVVAHALGRPVHVTRFRPSPAARLATAPTATKPVYTGLGFDACAAPSESAMRAWSSTYLAVGVYIGGANMTCAQPNLTSTWVGDQSAAGWHLIPTYVGLQAPSNSCGCAAIVPAQAAAEGAAAATDAIAQMQALGLGPGNPIYFDMEAYNPTTATTAAVLTFLSAWTTQLHASHYLSGVYSSSDSGIKDIAAAAGTSFVEPDDLWIANWNGQQTTTDPNVPATLFASHARLHQYAGAHNEKHGGVTINIDSDYLDGATAGASVSLPNGVPVTPVAPTLAVTPAVNGTVALHASWPGVATIGSWQLLAGLTPTTLTPVGSPVVTTGDAVLTSRSEFPYFEAQALDATGQPLGTSAVTPTPAHVAIYGRSAFVGNHGNGTVPVGCFTGKRCVISTTITAGHRVMARTGGEIVPAGGGRILHFSLSPRGLAKVEAARRKTLAVRIVARDRSGVTGAETINLVGFSTRGAGPARSVSDAPSLQLFGGTEFVFRRTGGGILAGCFAAAPCTVTATLSAGRTAIATSTPQSLGVNELGYIHFALTRHGRALMRRAKGNQLGVRVGLLDSVSGARAAGRVVLINYG